MLELAWASLRSRALSVGLTVLVITLSVVLLLGVERVRTQAHEGFASTVSGTDLIVGARSGPVNLLLYSVFHIGDPTNNVSWQSYQELSALPQVKWAVPLSLGDSWRGYRVVGTSAGYFEHYRYGAGHALAFADGRPFDDLYDAVIGAEVARAQKVGLGDEIVLAHGTGAVTLATHADKPFRVAGILQRTGTPVDSSLLVSLPAIEAIHVDWRSGVQLRSQRVSAEQARHQDLTPTSITAFMLGLNSRIVTFSVQRRINEYPDEAMLAILPGVTLQQLWQSLGTAERALQLISAMVVLLGMVSLVALLVSTLQERRREMAILRATGARPGYIAGLLVVEAVATSAVACVLALSLLVVASMAGRGWVLATFGLSITHVWPDGRELAWVAGVLAISAVAGLVPALLAYRRTLADGLSPGG
ncbi:ABC transporter permease [Stenotrophomonas maltophilia]|uniref:ABC transporter permease n=1 Tax=Stenotrophomonas maltophilia TaxID=40324 RepID=UPI0005B70B5F|nr:ABC transporter permease [Stenotrophomonas maltophilia]KIS41005.1 aBC-type antimicrobial peptide transport system, permease component [Stenotrophomonas maltophilia WJ66]KUP01269.1 peptide ABC transporter permease [Stenotrophomonas maltophilia]KZC92360.1 peptide ABC transporter permease [Stenotrophomonas maltophilia]MBA0228600.1 FtsX-like permease family protein [Stenotrophomonas maltophilia]MBA0289993.1 FtsX-like permease family protein [Stenotrophomonas maltophilia]